MLLEGHFQNAYVTRNLDKGLAELATRFGVRDAKGYETSNEITTPAGRGLATMKVAIAWVGNLQYEVIEPVSGPVDFYRDALPAGDGLGFHHICMRTLDWDALRQEIDRQKRTIVFEGATASTRFCYIDARDSLGHYLEYIWMKPETWARMGGR